MRKILSIISCLILSINIFSCRSTEERELTINGFLYFRNDLSTFVPWDEKDVTYNIIDATGNLSQLYKDTMLFFYIGEAAYAELKGTLITKKPKLFAQQLDVNNFTVNEVLLLSKRQNAPEDCCYCDYRGSESNWTLEISEVDEMINFRDDKTQQSYYFDYAEPIESNGTLTYSSQNIPMNNSIEIKINMELQAGELSSQKEFPVLVKLNDIYFEGSAKRCF